MDTAIGSAAGAVVGAGASVASDAASMTISKNIDEIIKLDGEVNDSYQGVKNDLTQIRSALEDLNANVKGTKINQSLQSCLTLITSITGKMDSSFDKMDTFVKTQMGNYGKSYEGAVALLKSAINFIDTNL